MTECLPKGLRLCFLNTDDLRYWDFLEGMSFVVLMNTQSHFKPTANVQNTNHLHPS
jgi:hypothetical protein